MNPALGHFISMLILSLAVFSGLYTFAFYYDGSEASTVVIDEEQRQRFRHRFKRHLPISIILFGLYALTFEYLHSF